LLQKGHQEGGKGCLATSDFARSFLRIKFGDSGGDNVSKGNNNDSKKRTGSDANGSDVAWSVSELISFFISTITILPFVFQHHTAWLQVSLGINEQKSEKYPLVRGRPEFSFFFGHV